MKPIIEVKNVGKKYNIKHYSGSYVSLRDVLMTVLKSPFQFFKEKAKAVAGVGTHEDFWALRNINFEVMPGEVVGIIGHNGAGKSTLLKILTGITPPTEGSIELHGRVSSLLEVGTGFHPELSGRENIFLNGAILGMKKAEIIKKFDEIVAFAGIEKFLDTPVKYYSSGMYVRLAFSVAAHMEPDILLVDEVLAVGDAEFQKKCLGKMEEVTHSTGRTILFVSHNMAAIQRLCKKCILLEKGQVKMIGPTHEVINSYTKSRELVKEKYEIEKPKNADSIHGFMTAVQIEDEKNNPIQEIPAGVPWQVRIFFTIQDVTPSFIIAMSVLTGNAITVRTTWSAPENLNPGKYEAVLSDKSIYLSSGVYSLNVGLSSFRSVIQYIENIASVKVTAEDAAIDPDRILTVTGGEIIINPMDIKIIKK